MQYLVLARKYRPQTFSEVVGQEHVTRTLSNAVSLGRVAHAILFSGPRGTGKTTVARILAKALNCEANREAPSPVPCNSCRSCHDIAAGNAVDVYEIDGASNNSVDQIRELRDNIRYLPTHSLHKIYIIDEVHMLSTAAFNALLKTLEEPPPHVKFFFATTEPHKIPITILSRCQRHDFRRIDLNAITGHLEFLCRQEHIDIAMESLELIAKEADGSMRDSLSLLDQVISSADKGTIEHEKLLDILGVVDRRTIFSISTAILNGQIATLLNIIEDVYDRGHDIKKLYSNLIEHFRNLLVAKITAGSDKLLNVPAHEIQTMITQVAKVPEPFLSQILNELLKEENSVKFSSQPKIAFEMALIRIHQIRPVLSIETLIEKLDGLKKAVAAGLPIADENIMAPLNGDPSPVSAQAPPLENQAENGKRTAPVTHDLRDFPTESHPIPTDEPDKSPNDHPDDKAMAQTPENFRARLLTALSKEYPSLSAGLAACRLRYLNDQHLEIKVAGSPFTLDRIQSDKNMAILQQVSRELSGRPITLDIVAEPIIPNETASRKDKTARLKKNAVSHPLVADTLEIFGGNVVDVKIL